MQTIGLKTAVITSDSTIAINYIHDLFNSPTPTRTQNKISNNSPSIEISVKYIKDITKNLNYVILIHTKGHQYNDFDAFTRSNQVAYSRAKMLAKALLANKIPRIKSISESEYEHNFTIPTRQISQSEDNNAKEHKEGTPTPQGSDKGSNATNEFPKDLPPQTV